jgi:hypothetical protein
MGLLELPLDVYTYICDSLRQFQLPPIDREAALADFTLFSKIADQVMRDGALKGRPDLGRLSRTCRQLREQTEPILYAYINLVSGVDPQEVRGYARDPRRARQHDSERVIDALVRTLLRRPELAQYIRRVDTEEAGIAAADLTPFCTHLRALDATRAPVITNLPNPQVFEDLAFHDDARAQVGPLKSIQWSAFTALKKLTLILRSGDLDDRALVQSTRETFATFPVRELVFKPTYEFFEDTAPFDINDLFIFAGSQTRKIYADSMAHIEGTAFLEGTGPMLEYASFGRGASGLDYSKFDHLTELHLTEAKGTLQVPVLTWLPPSLKTLHLHSDDQPLEVDDTAFEHLSGMMRAPDTRLDCIRICEEYYENSDTLFPRLDDLIELGDQYAKYIETFEDDDDEPRLSREWMRLICECKASAGETYKDTEMLPPPVMTTDQA